MYSKGQSLNNIRAERFFRNHKYDDIYIDKYNTLVELIKGINAYIRKYDTYRLHDLLGRDVPVNIYQRLYAQMSFNDINNKTRKR